MWLFSNVLYYLELLKAAQTLQCTKDVLSNYGHLFGHGGGGGALLHPPPPPFVVVVEADVSGQLTSLLGSLGEVRV